MKIWAFNKVSDPVARDLVYQSIKSGKSRFGWSRTNKNDLTSPANISKTNSKQQFLKNINIGDWIVHINTPEWGKCVAVQTTSPYQFDAGLQCSWGTDFRHCFDIDIDSLIEFNRRDKNILPSVNLNPRQRYHQIYSVEDFLKSIDNLKHNKVNLSTNESKQEYHLKDKVQHYLKEITAHIHEMNKGKDLEVFLAKVFRKIPGVVEVIENGLGGGTDHGADLIVKTRSPVGNLDFENIIIVQVKSFQGNHFDLHAVNQVKTGIEEYNGTAGMIITTAQRTEKLETKIEEISKDIDCPIDLLAGDDVAKFVIKHASDLVFRV